MVNYYLAKFSIHRHCDSGDIMVLIINDFNETVNPTSICEDNIESINYFFLRSPKTSETRQILFDNIKSIHNIFRKI